VSHRDFHHTRQLLGDADELAVHAALAEQLLRMRFLEIRAADLLARDVRGDRQHRHATAVGVEQAVDQMQVAGPAAGRADRQLSRHRRLAGGSERRRLLVAHVLPRDLAVAAQRVGEAVDRVSRQPVHPAHAGRLQGRHHHIRDRARHDPSFRQDAAQPPRIV
jgi:hypothetical protein